MPTAASACLDYNLCKGAGNPDGVARLMKCITASYYDENAVAINNEKRKADYGWSDEIIEMKEEVHRLTVGNPVRDMYNGLPDDAASLVSDTISKPIYGTDWYSAREAVSDALSTYVDDVNAQI